MATVCSGYAGLCGDTCPQGSPDSGPPPLCPSGSVPAVRDSGTPFHWACLRVTPQEHITRKAQTET